MTLIGIFTIGIFVFYAGYMIYFLTGLIRLKNNPIPKSSNEPYVSVVIAARNEEQNIRSLLDDLIKQTYPIDKLEIIISNDRSTDKTWSIIKEYSGKYDIIYGIQISELSMTMTPKKNALTLAIESSNGEIIISTDADCRVPETWVKNMVETFKENTGIVVGYSEVDTTSGKFFDQYQAVDFLALMAANAGSFGWNNPWTGSGQNIAYRRADFNKIDGFNPAATEVSGDDFYLVQAISKIAKAQYNIDPKGFVKTKPMESVREFISQRTRWASNSRKLFNTNLLFLLFLFVNLFTNIIFLLVILLKPFWQYLPMLLGFKFLFDSLIIFFGSSLFKTKIQIVPYLIWFFLQPLYTTILAILSILGKYRWKP